VRGFAFRTYWYGDLDVFLAEAHSNDNSDSNYEYVRRTVRLNISQFLKFNKKSSVLGEGSK